MPKVVAIIPARGGSKRIPKKNVKNFHGKPLITHTIQKLKTLALFDELIVSTDNADIANISRDCGASIHNRSAELSGDFTPTDAVLKNIVDTYSLHEEICCLMYPTSILIPHEHVKQGYDLIKKYPDKIIFTCTKFSSPPQRGFTLSENVPVSLSAEHRYTRTQDLPSIYFDIGGYYWMYGKNSLKNPYSDHGYAVQLPEIYSQDIDNLEDWTLAEMKYQYINSQL
jgi:pseudaminic acid cytidylyltransferase